MFKFVGGSISLFGLYIVYSGTMYPISQGAGLDPRIAVPSIIIGLLIAGLGRLTSSFGVSIQNTIKDSGATEVFENIVNESYSANFILYLRPFQIDMNFSRNSEGDTLFSLEQYLQPGEDALEPVLSKALESRLPIYGLGEGIKGMGTAGYLDNWKNAISLAIDKANIVLIVPSNTGALIWELRRIYEMGAVKKTIFLMPPNNIALQYTGVGDFNLIWKEASLALWENFGIRIPKYTVEGGVFSINESGEILNNMPFSGCSPKSIRTTLDPLLDEILGDHGRRLPLDEGAFELEDIENIDTTSDIVDENEFGWIDFIISIPGIAFIPFLYFTQPGNYIFFSFWINFSFILPYPSLDTVIQNEGAFDAAEQYCMKQYIRPQYMISSFCRDFSDRK